MGQYEFSQRDFDHPSVLFKIEDIMKGFMGERLIYYPYYRTFNLRGNEKVLDFGCGGGVGSRSLVRLLNKGGSLTCVDSSAYWINKARQRLQHYANADCISGDIRTADVPDGVYDIITTIRVLHDIAPDERGSIVEALVRKLKTGGVLFISDRIEPSHGMPVSEIRALLTAAGLEEMEHVASKLEYRGKFHKTA